MFTVWSRVCAGSQEGKVGLAESASGVCIGIKSKPCLLSSYVVTVQILGATDSCPMRYSPSKLHSVLYNVELHLAGARVAADGAANGEFIST